MNAKTQITAILTTNCTIVEAAASFHDIKDIFNYYPNRFLPVVEDLHFVGIIYREIFFQKAIVDGDQNMTARDLASKEMVRLAPYNTLEQAKEVFDANVFDVLPVVDEDGDLAGVLFREDVEKSILAPPSNPSVWSRIFS